MPETGLELILAEKWDLVTWRGWGTAFQAQLKVERPCEKGA